MNDLEEQLRQLPQAKPTESLDARMRDVFDRADQQAKPGGIPWWIFAPACIACMALGMWIAPAASSAPQHEVKKPEIRSIEEAPETVLVELRLQKTHPFFTSTKTRRPWYEQPARMLEQD